MKVDISLPITNISCTWTALGVTSLWKSRLHTQQPCIMYVQNTYRVSRVSTFFFGGGTKSFYETYILTKIIWKVVFERKDSQISFPFKNLRHYERHILQALKAIYRSNYLRT